MPDAAARQRHHEPGPQVGTSRALSRLPRAGPRARAEGPQSRTAAVWEGLAERGARQTVAAARSSSGSPVTSDPFGVGGGSGPARLPLRGSPLRCLMCFLKACEEA